MNIDLVKYLSSVMRGDMSGEPAPYFYNSQDDKQNSSLDLVKDQFLVDSTFSLGLDEII
jgi:hypothetical protein